MMTVLGIVLFFLGILFSIAWHELGHFTTARWFGIKVPEFMVGFGRTIWSRKVGETEFGLKAIPLGGYIRMIGMIPPAKGATLGREPAHRPVPRPHRRRPAAVGDGRAARGRGPPVLDARALEADHRDVRGAVHEPRSRGGPLRDRADGDRRADERHHHRHGQRVRGARVRRVRQLPGGRPEDPGRRGGLPARRPDRVLQRQAARCRRRRPPSAPRSRAPRAP